MITLHDNNDSPARPAQGTTAQDPPHTDAIRKSPVRQRALGMIESTIGNHPVASVGVALAAGIALGWWVKRR